MGLMSQFTDLDSLIAIHIYGWQEREYQNPSRTPGKIAFVGKMLVPPDAGEGWVGSPPHFSTNLLDAFAMAETIREERKLHWRMFSPVEGDVAVGYECVFSSSETLIIAGSAGATTLQEAICKAALKAVGAEIDESETTNGP